MAGSSSLVPSYAAVMAATSGHPNPYAMHDPGISQGPSTNDFRERFHRSLVAPSPFRAGLSATGTPPHNGGTAAAAGKSPTLESPGSVGPLDPQLGQARDEASGVADRLTRGE